MSNIFKRALSLSTSKEDSTVVSSPKGLSVSCKSPSFNDFSLCAQDDALEFQGGGGGEDDKQRQSLSARSSLDSSQLPLSPRWNYILGTQTSAPMKIPQQGTPAQNKDQQSAKTLPRQPEGKIGGMSYHDYCDLIRSCSL